MNRKSVMGLVTTFLVLLPLLSAAAPNVMAYNQISDFIIDAPHRVEPGEVIPVLVIIHAWVSFRLQSIDIIDDKTGHDVASRSYDLEIAANELYYSIFELQRNLFTSGDTVSIKARFRIENFFDRVIGPIDVNVGSQNLPKWDNWYAGDAHVHSSMTNNVAEFGAPVDAIASSAKAMGLDWVIITDHSHDISPFPGEWNTYKTYCDAETTDEFACMLGEEITCQDDGFSGLSEPASHYLAYGISSPVYAPDWWGGSNPTQQAAISDVKDNKGGVGFIAHPFAQPWDWENWAVRGYTGIEIWNSDWGSEDQQALNTWEDLVKQGRVAFAIGNSDAHDLTDVARYVRTYVDLGGSDLTRDNVITALRNGRFIVTNGPLLTFTADNHNMGEVFASSDDTVELRISWKSTSEYGKVKRIHISVGEQVQSVPVDSYEETITRTFTVASTELSCCLVSCETDTGRKAYANPIWVNPLTITGLIQHNDEEEHLVDSRYIKVEAWEKEALIDYKFAEGYTNDVGRFTLTHDVYGNLIRNEDPGLFESGTRDIYIKYFAENEAARVSENLVAGILGNTYSGQTPVDYDVTESTYSITVAVTSANSEALGLPALIKADRDWFSSITGGWKRDRLDVLYPDGDWPGFWPLPLFDVMRIPSKTVASWNDQTISHEYGHAVHYSARDGNMPLNIIRPTGEEDPLDWSVLGSGRHWIYSESSGSFALCEGWAEFFAAARHGDQSLETNHYWMGADGTGDFGPTDINTDGTTGEIVEGAFASILWDLYDGANDDGVNGGFSISKLWTVFLIDDPDFVWSSLAIDDFYHYWTGRYGQTRAVDEIFIDHGVKVTDDSHDSILGNDYSALASNLGTVDSSIRVEDLIGIDADWYKFTSSLQGNVDSEIAIEFDKSKGDLDLFVYLSDDTFIGAGIEFAQGKRFSLNGRSANTFKIKVVGAGDDSATFLTYEGDFSPNYDLKIALRGRSSGPDSFGYTFMDSNKPGGPSYDWVEISGTGTRILPSSDDQLVGNINLGFFFNYYGTDYSRLAIGNNGLLFSGVGSGQYVNDPITRSPSIHGLIVPYWDDIVTWGSADAIYYETRGTAPNRKFIVEWHDNQHYHSSSSGITFEAILYEGTNNMLFQYQDVSFGSVSGAVSRDNPPYDNGGSATVGIEDPTGNIGLQYSFNEQVVTPGLAILFKFPAFAGTNMHLSMNAPANMDHGNTMIYTLYYNDFGDAVASNVVLQTMLSSDANFVSASDSGTYDSATRTVTWNIGTVPAFPLGRGSRTVIATIPASVPVGTVIQTTASISTTTLETRYDDNSASAQTTVTGSNLPPNVNVSPTLGNSGGTPSVHWSTPITFTYYDATATGIDIRIHLDDGGSDITGSMTGGPPTWTYTATFYPRHGHATITYTVHRTAGDSQVNFNIYVDPAGYIYNAVTLERISGASVWLQRPDGQGGWESVPTSQNPPIMQPDINPQTTGADGQYQWDVLEGSYRVHVEAPGYYPADSIDVTVPPAVTDLHVGLTPLSPPPDPIPPVTTLTIGDPKYIGPDGNGYVTLDTPLILSAEDNVDGSGVALTGYRTYNATYDSGWIVSPPPIEFQLTGLTDGEYFIDYNSTDNAGNTELTNTTTLILDNTHPTTILTIVEPKYISDTTYVTPDTPFTLEATDTGSGIHSIAYRTYNATYDSGWLTYPDIGPLYLTHLTDGTYTIEYNSTDNVRNTERAHAVNVTLFSWNYIFEDTSGRGTRLKINTAHRLFQFVTPEEDYGIRNATYMQYWGKTIRINHRDEDLRLITVALDTNSDLCLAVAWDVRTGSRFLLVDKFGQETRAKPLQVYER